MADSFCSVQALLSRRLTENPLVCFRSHLVEARARQVVASFDGDVLYAVKCNDAPEALEALWRGGVREFDTASIAEIRLVRALLPGAICHFMHPVKSAAAITEAYHVHRVRRFVIDHINELDKIVEATGRARDLELFVRLAVPGQGALLTLTGKFGVNVDEAAHLVNLARQYALRVGVTFHVGSQCIDPEAFDRAIELAADVSDLAGGIDDLDVGGGFPAQYLGDEPGFDVFCETIARAVAREGLNCRLQCEPGRVLVADGASVLARVELRRANSLYLNDGVYGNLAELKWLGAQFPIRSINEGGPTGHEVQAFDLYGPTCDSIDSMPGPHWIRGAVAEGDWIEVGMMGAYSNALRTGFNGFGSGQLVSLSDLGWYLRDDEIMGLGQERLAA